MLLDIRERNWKGRATFSLKMDTKSLILNLLLSFSFFWLDFFPIFFLFKLGSPLVLHRHHHHHHSCKSIKKILCGCCLRFFSFSFLHYSFIFCRFKQWIIIPGTALLPFNNENWKYKTSIQGMQFLIFILYSHYVHKERRIIIFTRSKERRRLKKKKKKHSRSGIFIRILFEFFSWL